MLKLRERTGDNIAEMQAMIDLIARSMYFALPCIIQAVDYGRQTLVAQPAIRENIVTDGFTNSVEIPLLLDVPFFVYSGGGYCLTLPIKHGDECLVVFGDMCIDAWWQSSGVQDQAERRRHDLSDGFAIVGFRSQPQVVKNYSANTVQMRNEAGSTFIEINGNDINIVGNNIKINGTNITGQASNLIGLNSPDIGVTGERVKMGGDGGSNINITGKIDLEGETTIEGRRFIGHTHSGVIPGGGSTGGVD